MASLREIMNALESRYGSLESPDYSWVRTELEREPYAELMLLLGRHLIIEDRTDPNDDVAVQLRLKARRRWWRWRAGGGTPDQGWDLWLSLASRYGVLVRCRDSRSEVVTVENASRDERWLVKAIGEARVELLSREVLESPLPMTMFNVLGGRVRLINGLFSDRDMLPWSGGV